MHGGLKVYRGSPAAARSYVEADRARADDYYLTEGTGVAPRYLAAPEGVRSGGALDGDAYEAWVGGCDPATGAPKGRVRADAAAVRFVEVVVNGPKSWSLAAALHPDIAEAYDAAQDRAAQQIIGWLAQHATTRVGPRGHQVQFPVQQIEAAVVRHYTSRAGDPHRHLHLQINARVFAKGTWRGLHTVGVRDSLGAINGIGHAAVITDPQFRAASCRSRVHPGHGKRRDRGAGGVRRALQRPRRADRPQRRPVRGPSGGTPTRGPNPARRCAGHGTHGRGPKTAAGSTPKGDLSTGLWTEMSEKSGCVYSPSIGLRREVRCPCSFPGPLCGSG
jgi:conjugative relaxase-like TrwC/TraI family protein